MNRRGFLQSLIAAAAAPAIGRLPTPSVAQSVWFVGSGGVLYDVAWDYRLGVVKKAVTHVWECDVLSPASKTAHDG